MSENNTYQQQLAQEAQLWGDESERVAREMPPDWRYHRHHRQNVIMHTTDIDDLLNHIQPGMKVMEFGCASGFMTLAMAQRGADATGLDLSEKSLAVARNYYASIQADVKGSLTYQTVDLNYAELPANTYDVIAGRGVLHHLMRLDHVIDQLHQSLKPGGLLWISDTNGEEALSTVLIAAALTFVLPTQVSYGEKIRGLLRFGFRAPSRVKASIEAQGLSPFEGVGREHDWHKLVHERFTVEREINLPAFTGYVTAQLKAPDWLAIPFLKVMYVIDRFLVRLKLLRNTTFVLYARK
jgi:2-polyprenyl-3-methyl-5-hydroxy-6-metoxy-1,4-benzoquinol methylase